VTQLNEIYKCEICGNIVELTHAGVGELVCCGKPMILQIEKTQDEGNEKHVPVIEKLSETQVLIKVGSVEHPMEDNHLIEWIELLADGRVYRKYLKSGMKPEARFQINPKTLSARAYCNVHGLWKS